MRLLIIVISILSLHISLWAQNHEEETFAWEKKLSLKEVEDSAGYDFYKILLEKGILLETEIERVREIKYIKEHKRVSKRPYDIKYEEWRILGEKEELVKKLRTAIGKIIYEKPPKVLLVEGNVVYVLSTWGAVYRNDLYEISNYMEESSECEVLMPIIQDAFPEIEFE